MATIGIIGWGVVGQATGAGLARAHRVLWHNKDREGSTPLPELIEQSEYLFVCVPTPMYSDETGIDLTIVNAVVARVAPKIADTNKVLIVKSSVVPGTTAAYARRFPGTKFAMNPEFLTEINAPWDFTHPDRVVIGAEDEGVANRVARLYRVALGYGFKIFVTDPTSAEMVKYMANTFMAAKVTFANEMADLAEKLAVNYDDVQEMVAADPRIGSSFLKVTPYRGFGGKCFPKDTIALLGLAKRLKVDLSLVKAYWQKNLKIRKVKDWHEIRGAVGIRKVSKAGKVSKVPKTRRSEAKNI